MGFPDACVRILSVRRFIAVFIVIFAFMSVGMLFGNDPGVRERGKNTLQYLSETISHRIVELSTSRPSRPTLDIVVSLYKENLASLALELQDFRALPSLQDVDVCTVIYVKDDTADLSAIKAVTNATNVIRLSNIGREGGTFFSHIVLNWEYLARHTLFIQAEVHSLEAVKGKINDYFTVNTGVLPLGYLAACDCLSCTDSWDASRTFPRISQLYSALNGEMCPKEIALSYLGAMLVSAKRIRQRPVKVYEHLKAVLESDMDHWIHTDSREDWAFRDDPSEPYFGHSIERSYMVLWGCHDVAIVRRCGGWEGLAGRRSLEDPEWKCQCLDGFGESFGTARAAVQPKIAVPDEAVPIFAAPDIALPEN
jgi:hypothetical protein